MVTRADKGNSLVILPIKQYDSKIRTLYEQFPDHNKRPHQVLSVPDQKGYDWQQNTHPARHQMEIHKHDPHSTIHQRAN